ncbi:hypothetical protein CYLTODRAFT_379476 [Cylindrobasidium torrendii FP15055 ss-10]|uniref:2-(3-amino-3-carboxypropyl)histidine synthase subunit 1 n=1 Tax=Cylindrobasidium torrendii FP15055 ss-10 TaxID=1314674 RepID=A0A0D7B5I2_9AGAR|nr:hypothetical protein CYLTODRAFT_379476 [Cylindrobasidium torrendii FP15055 ss-10]
MSAPSAISEASASTSPSSAIPIAIETTTAISAPPSADASKPKKRKKFVGSTKKPTSTAHASTSHLPPPLSPALTAALGVLPSNYTFEVPKTLAMIKQHRIHTVGLQMPEGLQMYACVIGDILTQFAYEGEENAPDIELVILGDVTYGACCVDDYTARALGVELLVHYGHSCLVPMSTTSAGGMRTLYVFVEIGIDVRHAEQTVRANLPNMRTQFDDFIDDLARQDGVVSPGDKLGGRGRWLAIRGEATTDVSAEEKQQEEHTRLALVSTIQFATALSDLREALSEYGTLVPRSHPLSPGEILGCTAPTLSLASGERADAILYLGDGRFHLEAMMLANPGVPAFRYDPYSKKLTREGYDHLGMREFRRKAVETAAGSLKKPAVQDGSGKKSAAWGLILGTLGRQGSTGHLYALMRSTASATCQPIPILLSELSPSKLKLFNGHLDVFVQTSCPRLSVDWGGAFEQPLLSVYEAGVASGAWGWQDEEIGKHPMDFYKRGSRWAEARAKGQF